MDLLEENYTIGSRIRWGIRWILGLGLIFWAAHGMTVPQGGSIVLLAGQLLIAFAKAILGVALLAPTLANLAARPLLAWIDSIYLPGGKADKPPLSYHLADYYRKTRQTGFAIERYRNILRYYPKEAKAHAWLYLLLARDARKASAARARRRAARRLSGNAWREYSRIVDAETKR